MNFRYSIILTDYGQIREDFTVPILAFRRVDTRIHWVKPYPVDNAVRYVHIYLLASALSNWQCYPPFEEQLAHKSSTLLSCLSFARKSKRSIMLAVFCWTQQALHDCLTFASTSIQALLNSLVLCWVT